MRPYYIQGFQERGNPGSSKEKNGGGLNLFIYFTGFGLI